jgi:hypothetical protein
VDNTPPFLSSSAMSEKKFEKRGKIRNNKEDEVKLE